MCTSSRLLHRKKARLTKNSGSVFLTSSHFIRNLLEPRAIFLRGPEKAIFCSLFRGPQHVPDAPERSPW